MDELIDILMEDGAKTGKSAPKSEIHTKGHYHHTVHIWFYTKNGDILLSQRAASKSICPLLWDVSVAGHVNAGESLGSAAIREVEEEISLKITESDLSKIGVFKCFQTYPNGIIDNEFHNTYIAELKVEITNLAPQEDEVQQLKLVNVPEFKDILNHIGQNNHFVPSNKNYYEFVLNAIKQKLDDLKTPDTK